MAKIVVFADMAELVDALDSGSSEGYFIQVQVLLSAPSKKPLLSTWTREVSLLPFME